jgi:hypothetical protein
MRSGRSIRLIRGTRHEIQTCGLHMGQHLKIIRCRSNRFMARICHRSGGVCRGRSASRGGCETAKLQAYLRDLEKTKGQPDYSKPPASEYLKRIFAADALAALPAPKANDFGWLLDWVVSVNQTYVAMIMFGAKDLADENVGRNMIDYQDNTMPAAAFRLHLYGRIARTVPSLPSDERKQKRETIERVNQGMVQLATGMAGFTRIRLKLENVRLTAAALRDTVTLWAPLTTAKERADLLARLEKASVTNKDAGIDDAINFVSTAIKSVKD